MAGVDVDGFDSVSAVALTAVVGAVILVLIFLCNFVKKGFEKSEANTHANTDVVKPVKNGIPQAGDAPAGKKKERVAVRKKDSKVNFVHPWLACNLKGHSGSVLGLDFSPNGKYLASCSEDRTVHLWSVKEFNKKDHKSTRVNIDLDHATHVRFSPDCRAFIVNLHTEETVRVFKMSKKEDSGTSTAQVAFDFPKKHSAEIINIGIASNGKFIMTCYADTTLKIWDLKGELLSTVDTRQMNNTYGCVSPCGRFVASSGFTPDVKVWEVCFDKSGNFQDVRRAFELKGHTAGVHWFAFSADSYRMASVSKDGTWRYWDTNVEYTKNQDPYLLRTWQYNSSGPRTMIALSPDARTVALSTSSTVSVYNVTSDDCVASFQDVFSSGVTALEFSINSRFLVVAGDKHVAVFHNVAGYRSTIAELEDKKKSATSAAMRERLQAQIDEARDLLQSVDTVTT